MSRRIRFNLHGSYGDPFFDNLQASFSRIATDALHMDRNDELARKAGGMGPVGICAAVIRNHPRLRCSRKLKKLLKTFTRYQLSQELSGALPVFSVGDIPEPYASDLDAFTDRFARIQDAAPIEGVILK